MLTAYLTVPSTVREGGNLNGVLRLSGFNGSVTYEWWTSTGTAGPSDFGGSSSSGMISVSSSSIYNYYENINVNIASDRVDELSETLYINVLLHGATFAGGTAYYAIIPVTILDDAARHGTSGADTMLGNAAADELIGWNGHDLILGYAGADILRGEAGNDTLMGGDGNDRVEGGEGNDRLRGDAGNDTVTGGNGDDVLLGGSGSDSLSGEADNDVLYAGEGNDVLNGGDGNDFMAGEGGNDVLRGGNGNDRLAGNDGNDILFGDAGDDRLNGAAGNDTLLGGVGNDQLYGGDGNDQLTAADGRDVLVGGNGADTFIFRSGQGRAHDFENDIDTIVIARGIAGAGTTVADLLDNAIVGNGVIHLDFGANGRMSIAGVQRIQDLVDDLIIA